MNQIFKWNKGSSQYKQEYCTRLILEPGAKGRETMPLPYFWSSGSCCSSCLPAGGGVSLVLESSPSSAFAFQICGITSGRCWPGWVGILWSWVSSFSSLGLGLPICQGLGAHLSFLAQTSQPRVLIHPHSSRHSIWNVTVFTLAPDRCFSYTITWLTEHPITRHLWVPAGRGSVVQTCRLPDVCSTILALTRHRFFSVSKKLFIVFFSFNPFM